MIPAIWGAVKAATWAQRGISAGVMVGAIGLVFGWGYLNGRDACQEEHTEAVLAQALDVTKHAEAKADALATSEHQHDRVEQQSAKKAEVVRHEVIKYVQVAKPIDLDPEYQRVLVRIGELQRDAENRVSEAHAAAKEVDELRAHKATTNQLLQSYYDLADARRKDLDALMFAKEFERVRYEAEMAFYNQLPLTAKSDE